MEHVHWSSDYTFLAVAPMALAGEGVFYRRKLFPRRFWTAVIPVSGSAELKPEFTGNGQQVAEYSQLTNAICQARPQTVPFLALNSPNVRVVALMTQIAQKLPDSTTTGLGEEGSKQIVFPRVACLHPIPCLGRLGFVID